MRKFFVIAVSLLRLSRQFRRVGRGSGRVSGRHGNDWTYLVGRVLRHLLSGRR